MSLGKLSSRPRYNNFTRCLCDSLISHNTDLGYVNIIHEQTFTKQDGWWIDNMIKLKAVCHKNIWSLAEAQTAQYMMRQTYNTSSFWQLVSNESKTKTSKTLVMKLLSNKGIYCSHWSTRACLVTQHLPGYKDDKSIPQLVYQLKRL